MNSKAVVFVVSCGLLSVVQSSADTGSTYFSGDVSEEALLNAFAGGNQSAAAPVVTVTETSGTRDFVFGEAPPVVYAQEDEYGYRDISWQVVDESTYVAEDFTGGSIFVE